MSRRVFVAIPLPDSVMNLLRRRAAPTFAGRDRPLGIDELAAGATGHEAVLITATNRMDAPAIARLPDCVKALATYSVGNEHIDLDAAKARGLAVFSTPGVLTDAVADNAMFLLLGASRRATESIDLIRSGQWRGWSPLQLNGVGLTGKRLAILGMGRIGRAIAQRARAFGMEIDYCNTHRLPPELEQGATYHPTPEALLATAHFLMLAAPASPATTHILDARRIALMPRGAIVVNIGRGALIDDQALADALASGQLAGAGLDVFEGEPAVYPRYFTLPNLFMVPHIGSSTIETREAMAAILMDGLDAFFAGRPSANRLV